MLRRRNHLHWFTLNYLERCTQTLMTPHDFVETSFQHARIETPTQTHGGGNVVQRVPGFQLVQEQQSLLSKREWQMVISQHGGQIRRRRTMFEIECFLDFFS